MVETGDEAGRRIGGGAGCSILGDEEVGSTALEDEEAGDCSWVLSTLCSVWGDSDGRGKRLLSCCPSTTGCATCSPSWRLVFVVLLV